MKVKSVVLVFCGFLAAALGFPNTSFADELVTGRHTSIQDAADFFGISLEEIGAYNPDAEFKRGEVLTDGGGSGGSEPPPPVDSSSYTAYLTGYGWPDNDCGGGGGDCTWYAQTEGHAGGTGTYEDPITLAVGEHSGFSLGQRFYISAVRAYFKVQDTCAGCDQGHNGYPWLDMWHGQDKGPVNAMYACQSSHTGYYTVVQDPPSGLPVVSGGLFEGGVCRTIYGN